MGDRRWEIGDRRQEAGDRKQGSVVWYVGTLVLFAMGLMSKPMLVTMPFLLLMLDFWPLKRLSFAECHDGIGSKSRSEEKPNGTQKPGASRTIHHPSSIIHHPLFRLILEKLVLDLCGEVKVERESGWMQEELPV